MNLTIDERIRILASLRTELNRDRAVLAGFERDKLSVLASDMAVEAERDLQKAVMHLNLAIQALGGKP